MNILVAGGAGFVGSNFCQLLLSKGHKVWAVDNLITGRKENLDSIINNNDFSFIQADVIDPQIKDRLEEIEFQAVYHFASPASPPWYQKYPLETLEVNSIGTKNLLEIAKRDNAKFIFASTSEVYGDPLEHPQKETYWGNVNSFGARSCYDEAKRYGEAICYTYLKDFNVDVRIVRIFNTYGPNMDPKDGRVVSNFVTQAIRGENLTMYGDGSQTRAFCYVDDLIRGFYLMLTKDVTGEVINLGNPGEFTMLELAKIVNKKVGNSSQITYQDLPQDDPKKRRPDISKAKELLGWEPEIALKDGLEKTIEYFKTVVK
ncbi:MAG: SDR family oxidoreductase [Candidatus Pacebacteria bacterium]|nr:SDR family oxidoreductase [Candidatus Paceibacterota bacterium]